MIVNQTPEESNVVIWTIEITSYRCGKHLWYQIVCDFALVVLIIIIIIIIFIYCNWVVTRW